MTLTQKSRRCITVPVWCAAVLFHLILWGMWITHSIAFAPFWKWEKIACAVTVVMAVTEISMNDPGDGSKRGFDVLPKD